MASFFQASFNAKSHQELAQELEAKLLEKAFDEQNRNTKKSKIQTKNGIINVLSIKNGESNDKNIFFTHGYASGLGHFFKNYESIMKANPEYNLYAMDWLGSGLSSKIDKPSKKKGETNQELVERGADLYIKTIEEIRQKLGLEKMVLIAHSMGGYLSTLYSLKYPEIIEKLILLSPFGVNPAAGPHSGFTKFLINTQITPQSVMKSLGLMYKYFNRNSMRKSYDNLDSEERNLFIEYFYQINSIKGSGDFVYYFINEAFPLKEQTLSHKLTEAQVDFPIYFLYGDSDHMDPSHALELIGSSKNDIKVVIVPNSGHQLHAQNYDYCNTVVNNIMRNIDLE